MERKKKKKKVEREIQEGDGGTSEGRRAILSGGVYFFQHLSGDNGTDTFFYG